MREVKLTTNFSVVYQMWHLTKCQLLILRSDTHTWVNEYEALVKWYWQGKTKGSDKNLSQCHLINKIPTCTGLSLKPDLHFSANNAKVKNKWSYSHIYPHDFMMRSLLNPKITLSFKFTAYKKMFYTVVYFCFLIFAE